MTIAGEIINENNNDYFNEYTHGISSYVVALPSPGLGHGRRLVKIGSGVTVVAMMLRYDVVVTTVTVTI